MDLSVIDPATRVRGFLGMDSPGNPAAGGNYSFGTGGLKADAVRVISCIATLTTDANVANRLFALDFINGRGKTVIRNAAPVLVTASTTNQVFQWDCERTMSEWNTGTPVFVPINEVPLEPGWTVQLTIDSVQAGDQISAITFLYELFYPDSPELAAC